MIVKFLNESKDNEVFRKLEGNQSLLKFAKSQRWGGLSSFDSKFSDDFMNRNSDYFSKLTDGKQGLWFQPTEDSLVMLISERSFNEFRNTVYFMGNSDSQVWKLIVTANTLTHPLGTKEAKECSRLARNFMYKISKWTDKTEIYSAIRAEYFKKGWGGYID